MDQGFNIFWRFVLVWHLLIQLVILVCLEVQYPKVLSAFVIFKADGLQKCLYLIVLKIAFYMVGLKGIGVSLFLFKDFHLHYFFN